MRLSHQLWTYTQARVSTSRGLVNRPTFGLSLLLALTLAATPAAAFIGDVTFAVNPSDPTAAEEVLIQISGISTPTASVAEVVVDGQLITVRIDDTCLGLCPAEGFDFDVLVGPLAAGSYEVDVTDNFGTSVASTAFDVSVAPLDGLLTRAFVEPVTPNDNEHLRILVTAVTCEGMDLVSTSVNGNVVEIRGVVASSGCGASVAETSAFSASVGPLEPGDYEVRVLLQDSANPDAGFQLASTRQVRIGDAPDAVALRSGRFEVRVDWKDHDGLTGVGRPVPGASESTTLFSFFGRDNWELMVKVLDGCALNDHFWVFTAASTDVEYTLEVTDTSTGEVRAYTNQLGQRAPATTDVEAFETCSD